MQTWTNGLTKICRDAGQLIAVRRGLSSALRPSSVKVVTYRLAADMQALSFTCYMLSQCSAFNLALLYCIVFLYRNKC